MHVCSINKAVHCSLRDLEWLFKVIRGLDGTKEKFTNVRLAITHLVLSGNLCHFVHNDISQYRASSSFSQWLGLFLLYKIAVLIFGSSWLLYTVVGYYVRQMEQARLNWQIYFERWK